MKRYSHAGLAGCVQQTKARSSGTLIGVYAAEQAGIDADTETPWVTVCEPHSSMVTSSTLALAKASARAPHDWCMACQEAHG